MFLQATGQIGGGLDTQESTEIIEGLYFKRCFQKEKSERNTLFSINVFLFFVPVRCRPTAGNQALKIPTEE